MPAPATEQERWWGSAALEGAEQHPPVRGLVFDDENTGIHRRPPSAVYENRGRNRTGKNGSRGSRLLPNAATPARPTPLRSTPASSFLPVVPNPGKHQVWLSSAGKGEPIRASMATSSSAGFAGLSTTLRRGPRERLKLCLSWRTRGDDADRDLGRVRVCAKVAHGLVATRGRPRPTH